MTTPTATIAAQLRDGHHVAVTAAGYTDALAAFRATATQLPVETFAAVDYTPGQERLRLRNGGRLVLLPFVTPPLGTAFDVVAVINTSAHHPATTRVLTALDTVGDLVHLFLE